jgi:hypothetical protein
MGVGLCGKTAEEGDFTTHLREPMAMAFCGTAWQRAYGFTAAAFLNSALVKRASTRNVEANVFPARPRRPPSP